MSDEQRDARLEALAAESKRTNELLETLVKTLAAGLGHDIDELKKKALITML